ncbi:uncharacterized protein LOC132174228 [Corylus avellana]|uniref:uncharacterized protein LOC132174228 n=1 Tax=Corylus avellana TaxID=13451 RepID=UPI00286D3EEA|nr:uncharacterized protein LOC132174228 [Corylus avellana]
MEELRVKLRFAVDPVGRSGGIALLWKDVDVLEIQNFSRRHINVTVTCQDTAKYGIPWPCLGDFNEIVAQEEKSGSALRRVGEMELFRGALEECRLSDLGFTGPKFTWTNCRAVANKEWCVLHQTVEKTKLLEALHRDEGPANWEEIKKLQSEIDIVLECEDCKWKQCALQNWYQYGDRKTPFFHVWANHRRKVNNIRQIQDEEGRYYQNLFSAGESVGIEECLATLDTRVTTEMNADLSRVFTAAEVEAALN